MTTVEAAIYVDKLAVLRRMPRGDQAQKTLIAMFARLAEDDAHAERIVDAMLDQYSDWPGPAPLRQIATDTHPGRERDQGALVSQSEQWEREFLEKTLGGLCLKCNGFGVVQDPATKRIERCTCPEGRPKWVNPATGVVCSPDVYGAVHYNSDEWIEGFNRTQGKRRWMSGTLVEKKPPAPATELIRMPVTCPQCEFEAEVKVAAPGPYRMRCQKCGQWVSFYAEERRDQDQRNTRPA